MCSRTPSPVFRSRPASPTREIIIDEKTVNGALDRTIMMRRIDFAIAFGWKKFGERNDLYSAVDRLLNLLSLGKADDHKDKSSWCAMLDIRDHIYFLYPERSDRKEIARVFHYLFANPSADKHDMIYFMNSLV